MLRNEKQIGRIRWFFYLQTGRLRDKWQVFHCYIQSSFTLKRVKLTEFLPKNEGNMNGRRGNLDSDKCKYCIGRLGFHL